MTNPKSIKVSSNDFCLWTHDKRNKYQKCFCGKYACIGFNYRFGMLELLCFEHYKERIENGSNKETKKTTNGFTKSYSQETKEERKEIKCQNITEKQKQANLL